MQGQEYIVNLKHFMFYDNKHYFEFSLHLDRDVEQAAQRWVTPPPTHQRWNKMSRQVNSSRSMFLKVTQKRFLPPRTSDALICAGPLTGGADLSVSQTWVKLTSNTIKACVSRCWCRPAATKQLLPASDFYKCLNPAVKSWTLHLSGAF